MPKSVQFRTLEIALQLAGGLSGLARYTGVPARNLLAMVEGTEEISTWVFLRCVDCVNDLQRWDQPPLDAERHDGNDTRQ